MGEGRKEAASYNLQIYQKIPILLSEIHQDILFPTKAIRNPECIWINYRAIDEVKRSIYGTKIVFHDDSQLNLCVDIRSIRRSLRLCERYLYLLNKNR